MLFNSPEFLVFFGFCLAAYWLLRGKTKAQNHILLVASYVFYAWWDIRFLTLITLSTAIDYCCAIGIAHGKVPRTERLKSGLFLALSSLGCLGIDWSSLIDRSPNFRGAIKPLTENSGFLLALCGISLGILMAIYLCERFPANTKKRAFAGISIIANLGILGVFKYYNFFANSFSELWQSAFGSEATWTTTQIILPVGISFYTFQTMSYTIDVFRGKLGPSKSILEFATYVSFFPQLVAGPIERAAHLIPQFQRVRHLGRERLREGLWLMLWGFYKKLVVADNLAPLVDRVFNQSESGVELGGPHLMIGLYAFAFQIYCDFSGYTDIARGVAKLLGFDLMLNFNLPYASRSPSDFWRRWHISLSSWLRDYLYIPLGGNRAGHWFTYRNLMITMTLGGLWHGAAWNFVAWGIYQGAILITYRHFAPNIDSRPAGPLRKLAEWLLMFQLICIGWLLFRVQSLASAPRMLSEILLNWRFSESAASDLRTLLFYSLPLIAMQIWQLQSKDLSPVLKTNGFLRLNILLFLLYALLTFSATAGNDFIYFAF